MLCVFGVVFQVTVALFPTTATFTFVSEMLTRAELRPTEPITEAVFPPLFDEPPFELPPVFPAVVPPFPVDGAPFPAVVPPLPVDGTEDPEVVPPFPVPGAAKAVELNTSVATRAEPMILIRFFIVFT